MPKLKSIDFQGRPACGDTLAFTSQVTASADGIFAATVSEEIASAINSLRAKGTQQDVWTDQPRTNHRAVSKDLEKLKRAIKAGIDEHLSVETVVERVIVYAVTLMFRPGRTAAADYMPTAMLEAVEVRRGDGILWVITCMPLHITLISGSDYMPASMTSRRIVATTHSVRNSVGPNGGTITWNIPPTVPSSAAFQCQRLRRSNPTR